MDKKNIIAGNWKMNKTISQSASFIKELIPKIQNSRASVYIAPSFTSLNIALELAKGSNIKIGAQNMHDKKDGAYTGEVSAEMLKDLNCSFVILGHSERRVIFKEDDNFINRKVISALANNLEPILCIGETLLEKEQNQTESVISSQLEKGLKNVGKEECCKIIIAYEPVWAIGMGKSATTQVVESVHSHIRKILIKLFDKQKANEMSILYGGSVKADNAQELMDQENIDGVLVGGASLDVLSFSQIVNKG